MKHVLVNNKKYHLNSSKEPLGGMMELQKDMHSQMLLKNQDHISDIQLSSILNTSVG
jgi:hypothetical protein